MPETTAPATVYRFAVRYFIVDSFGTLLWAGSCTISQDVPAPTDPLESAYWTHVNTANTIRATCDKDPNCPPGTVVITAVRPA